MSVNLSDEFWESSQALRYIRFAAWDSYAPADAVLYGILARIAAGRPHQVRLDTGMLRPTPLNYLVALCADSGGGKSSADDISADLLELTGLYDPTETCYLRTMPFGSGEGIPESYMGTVTEPDHAGAKNKDGSPKMIKVRQQVYHNVFMFADEGRALTELMRRSGSTLGETIRSAWSGKGLGQANGRADTTRLVTGYSFGAVVGFQPASIGPLIAETDLGTAQRFMFVSAIDPSIRKPPPGDKPDHYRQKVHVRIGPVTQNAAIAVEQPITDELVNFHLGKQRGEIKVMPGNEHRNLLKAKTAALLMMLETLNATEGTVTQSHWERAELMVKTSEAVRDLMREQYGAIDLRNAGVEGARIAARRLGEQDTMRAVAETRIKRKHAEGKSVREIQQSLGDNDRRIFPDAASIRAVLEQFANTEKLGE